MDQMIKALEAAQNKNGSFKDARGQESVVATALVLSAINLFENSSAEKIKNSAFKWLLEKGGENLFFSKNLGLNFFILAALAEYQPEIITGKVLANSLLTLAEAESREGGLYYCSKENKNIDLGVNAAIGYFLSTQKVFLPTLDKIAEEALQEKNFRSEIFDENLTCYCLLKFHRFKKEKGAPTLNQKNIFLLTSKNRPSGLEYLNIAYRLAFRQFFRKKEKSADKKISSPAGKEEKTINKIVELAKKEFKKLPPRMAAETEKTIKRTIRRNPDRQMSLMAYYLKIALGKKGKKIAGGTVEKMGLANIFFWAAFIIYDDFWDRDEKADPKLLPIANFFARRQADYFKKFWRQNKFFHSLMDDLDAANFWETANCRFEINDNKFIIPDKLPAYGNYEIKYRPASGHILGPVAVFRLLGHKESSLETKNLISYFKNYLIAMQINDDLHDWGEDLKRGHLSTVVSMLLDDWKKKYPLNKEIDLKKDSRRLKNLFWFKTIKKACAEAIVYSRKSQQALSKIKILENTEPLARFFLKTERAAEKALAERAKSIEFLKTIKNSSPL